MKRIFFLLLLISTFAKSQTGNFYVSHPVVGGPISINYSNPIGTIYDSSSWNNLSSFLTPSADYTISGNKIAVAARTSGNVLTFPNASMLDDESLQVDFKYGTLSTSDQGFLIGWSSTGNISQSQISLLFYHEIHSGADQNKLIIVQISNGSAVNLKSTSTVSISAGDSVSYIITNNAPTCTFTVVNNSTGLSASYGFTTNWAWSGGTGAVRNTGQVVVSNGQNFVSTETIYRIKWYSSEPKQAQAALLGNSIAQGSYAGSYLARFGTLAGFVISAGAGDVTQQYVNHLHELIYVLQPKYVFIECTANDLAFSISTTTTHNNLQAVHDSLVAHGIGVYWIFSPPRNAINVTTLNNFISTTYGAGNCIDVYTPLWSGSGTSLNAAYDAGDGVHPNPAGHLLIANTIIASAIYKSISNGNYIAYNSSININGLNDPNAFANAAYVQVYQDSIKHRFIDTSNNSNGNVLAYNSVTHTFYLTPQTGGGSGNPVGGDFAIQYDSLGAFSGNISTFSWDRTNKVFSLPTVINTQQTLAVGPSGGFEPFSSNDLMIFGNGYYNSGWFRKTANPFSALEIAGGVFYFHGGVTGAANSSVSQNNVPLTVDGTTGSVGIGSNPGVAAGMFTVNPTNVTLNANMLAASSSSGDSVLVLSNSSGVETFKKRAQSDVASGGPTSGSYTPSLTNTTNITSSSLGQATYTQVGNIVTVFVGGTITPTTSATTVLTVALPVSTSTTTQSSVGTGVENMTSSWVPGIVNVVSGTTAQFNLIVNSSGFSQAFSFSFQYHTN